jgi:predicted Zn-dependent protease with MMP-like domain
LRIACPLSSRNRQTPSAGDQSRLATPARIMVYRRPLMARSDSDAELAELVFDVGGTAARQ